MRAVPERLVYEVDIERLKLGEHLLPGTLGSARLDLIHLRLPHRLKFRSSALLHLPFRLLLAGARERAEVDPR
jgi:hypothetical protein